MENNALRGPSSATPALCKESPNPRMNERSEQLWTLVDLHTEIDRFEAMLRASGKKHATIASYVCQSERFLNWLEGNYRPLTRRLGAPHGWRVSDYSVSKYDPLRDHLKANPNNAVRMTFREIETVLGAKLPPSARRYAFWWANDRTGNHSQAYAWMSAGRSVAQLDLVDQRVMFIRTGRNLRPSASRTFD